MSVHYGVTTLAIHTAQQHNKCVCSMVALSISVFRLNFVDLNDMCVKHHSNKVVRLLLPVNNDSSAIIICIVVVIMCVFESWNIIVRTTSWLRSTRVARDYTQYPTGKHHKEKKET
jgi:hypothetical protein